MLLRFPYTVYSITVFIIKGRDNFNLYGCLNMILFKLVFFIYDGLGRS